MREQLTELLKNAKLCSYPFGDQYSDSTIEKIADHLLANDVKPIIRCKDCAYYDHGECTMFPICLGGDFYCGRAEPKEREG